MSAPSPSPVVRFELMVYRQTGDHFGLSIDPSALRLTPEEFWATYGAKAFSILKREAGENIADMRGLDVLLSPD